MEKQTILSFEKKMVINNKFALYPKIHKLEIWQA